MMMMKMMITMMMMMMIHSNGDVFEFRYVRDVVEGPSMYRWAATGQVEEAEYQAGVRDDITARTDNNNHPSCVQVKHGPGRELSAAGDVETRTWRSGQLHGPAQVAGANGDRLEFCYVEVGGSL